MAEITLPEEIILPIPENVKEQELFKTLQDNHRHIRDSFSAIEDINAVTAGTGLTDTSDTFSVNVDDSTVELSSDKVQVKDDGITGAKLAPAVAGSGLVQDVSGNLDINVDDSTIEIDTGTDTVIVKDSGITLAKQADLANLKVIGRVSGTTGVPESVSIIDDDSMATASSINLSTAESIKAYVDSSGGDSGSEIFTADGTFTVPSGVTQVFVTLVGGGGGSGGANFAAATPASGGSGGGGSAIINMPYKVTAADITVVVGGGGTAGVGSTSTNGGVGESSTFDGTLTAIGGGGGITGVGGGGTDNGAAGAGGVITPTEGDAVTFTAGAVIYHPSTVLVSGGDGAAGTGGGFSAGGGASILGIGGVGTNGSGDQPGISPASGYGGGAGGSQGRYTDQNGAAGADGIVIVRW